MTALRARPPRRALRISGWGLYVVAVAALRLAGLGAPPPEVQADPTGLDRRGDPAIAAANQALGWILVGYDVAAFVPATERCLEAGAACTSDDVLDADTTRDRLASLASALGEALDPGSPRYGGPADGATSAHADEVRAAAAAAARGLEAFLMTGCAGSVDGVVVEHPVGGCDRTVTEARRALAAVVALRSAGDDG